MVVLRIVRDIVVTLAALAVLYAVAAQELDRRQRENDLVVRRVQVNRIIAALEKTYKAAVFDDSDNNKGIYHQIFRQNEIALEYQKLLLTRDLMPLEPFDPNALPAPAGAQ